MASVTGVGGVVSYARAVPEYKPWRWALILGLGACHASDASSVERSSPAAAHEVHTAEPRTVEVTLQVVATTPEELVERLPDPGLRAQARPLSGVEACIHGHPEIACALTGESGTFTLRGVPAETQLVLTLAAEGYLPRVLPLIIDRADLKPVPEQTRIPLFRAEDLTAVAPGVALDPSKGHLTAMVITATQKIVPTTLSAALGASVSLLSPAGEGPFFTDGRGRVDKSATTTAGGMTYFLNLPAGEHEVVVRHPDRACQLFGAIAFPAPVLIYGHLAKEAIPESVAIGAPVLPGHVTTVMSYCP